MKPILVTGYVNPDLDAVAGATAYCEYMQKTDKESEVAFVGELHDEAKYILNRYKLPYPQSIQDSSNFDEVILVDASTLIGLEGKITPSKVIEIIDHRKVHEADKFPNAKIQIELVGSACTLVAERFIKNNVAISKDSAILLCGGIISNTLNFKGSITTNRDKLAYKYLNKTAQLSEDFWKELFQAKSDLSGNKLEKRIRGDFAWFVVGNKKLGIAQLEIVGAEKLIEERLGEISEVLEKIKSEMNLDFIFQNIIELEKGKNFFITPDTATKSILEKVLNIKFKNYVAERPNLIMRKQLVPLLKEELESNV